MRSKTLALSIPGPQPPQPPGLGWLHLWLHSVYVGTWGPGFPTPTMPAPLKSWSRPHLPRALERPHLLWNKAQEWIRFATPSLNLPSSSRPYLRPSGRGGCPRVSCWAGALSTRTGLTGSRGRCRDRAGKPGALALRTPRRLLRKLSRCVPAQEEEEKGGGRIEADHPPPASSVSRRGKEEANWFVAQNSVGNRVMENDGWKVAKK